MLESQFENGNHLLRDYRIGWYASIWSSYQALNALYFAALPPDGQQCRSDFEDNVRAIDAYYWDTSYRGSPAAFDQGPAAIHFHPDPPRVDDSLWMALAVDTDYLANRDPLLLRRAEAVFRMAIANWDPANGGIFWENHRDGATDSERAIVSNAPAIVLGAALYSETGRSSYLTWSSRILHWLQGSLLDPGTGLYDDHINGHPGPVTIDTDKLTYNQGIMVGAYAALAVADPRHYQLSSAIQLAVRSMAYFGAHHSYGHPAWDEIWAQYLLWVSGLSGNRTFAGQARSSVGLARRADPVSSADLLDRAGAMALRELAKLPATDYGRLSAVQVGVTPRVGESSTITAPGRPSKEHAVSPG